MTGKIAFPIGWLSHTETGTICTFFITLCGTSNVLLSFDVVFGEGCYVSFMNALGDTMGHCSDLHTTGNYGNFGK